MILAALDPGLRCAGLAIFRDGVLQVAKLVKSPVLHERGPVAWLGMAGEVVAAIPPELRDVDRIVVESQQIYMVRRKKAGVYGPSTDPDNLIQLAGVNGAVVARVDAKSHRLILPRVWKSSTDKDEHNQLVLAALTEEERGHIEVCAPSLRHNVLDGIGLGLFDIGRIDNKGHVVSMGGLT